MQGSESGASILPEVQMPLRYIKVEMFKDMEEISKEEFEEIWAEAMRRCVDKA